MKMSAAEPPTTKKEPIHYLTMYLGESLGLRGPGCVTLGGSLEQYVETPLTLEVVENNLLMKDWSSMLRTSSNLASRLYLKA
jgi:hypothetical protein